MVLGKTVGDIPHHFSICTFSNSNNELLHSSLPHIKIKHTDCSNCSGEPYHCTLLNLRKCIWKLPVPHLKHTEITSQIFTTARSSPVHTYNYTHPTCILEQILFAIYTHTYIHIYQMYKIDNCVQCCTEEEWPDITPTGRHFTKTRIYW